MRQGMRNISERVRASRAGGIAIIRDLPRELTGIDTTPHPHSPSRTDAHVAADHRITRSLFATVAVAVAALLVVVPSRPMEAALVSASGTAGIGGPGAQQRDSAQIVRVVHRYHAFLEAGDSTAALALLAPDAVILESGSAETRAEYRAHHLISDITFARAVRSERRVLRVSQHGDQAWVASTSTTKGTYRDRAVDSVGAELVVLRRLDGAWKITAIHWSSRAA